MKSTAAFREMPNVVALPLISAYSLPREASDTFVLQPPPPQMEEFPRMIAAIYAARGFLQQRGMAWLDDYLCDAGINLTTRLSELIQHRFPAPADPDEYY